MLKKLMLLSVVMLTVGGSLQAMSGEAQAVKARHAAVTADIKASRGTEGDLHRKQVLLRRTLDNLIDVLNTRDDEDRISREILGKRQHDPALDIEIDELRGKVDQAEAAVLVAE